MLSNISVCKAADFSASFSVLYLEMRRSSVEIISEKEVQIVEIVGETCENHYKLNKYEVDNLCDVEPCRGWVEDQENP